MGDSKPLHPATVHFPIAFLSLAYSLDAAYGATAYLRLPVVSNWFGSSLADLGRAAHYLQILGLITGIPAVISGVSQLQTIIGNGGIYEADGKTIRKKVKITLVHAAMNDAIVLASAYDWWTRRNNTLFAPTGLSVALSVVSLPILLYSAALGGALVYNYGTGLNITAGKKGKST